MSKKKKLVEPKPHPRWGATKSQGKRYARERELLNQIHELKLGIDRLEGVAATAQMSVHRLQNVLVGTPLEALRAVIAMPVAEAVRLGLLDEVAKVARWVAAAEVASGK